MSTSEPHSLPSAEDLASRWPAWPSYGTVSDLLPTLERWAADGHRVVLATLANIVGSSPRPLGSEMIISDTGEVAGYVSGGCVEGAVAAEAMAVMRERKPRLLDYGAGSPVLDVQLTCGGRIAIAVRELADPADHAARLRRARMQRVALRVHTDLHTGEQHYFVLSGAGGHAEPELPGFVFAQTYLPPVRLMIVGDNPVALALCQQAPALDIETGLLRPYGPVEPPLDVHVDYYDRRGLETAVAEMPLDAWTAVYTVTHHAEDDQTVLLRALPSAAFCVGVLGSRGKIEQRLAQLSDAGLSRSVLGRLHAPAGLAIDARGPNEIALAILAQVIATQPHPDCIPPQDLAGLTTDPDGDYPTVLAACPV